MRRGGVFVAAIAIACTFAGARAWALAIGDAMPAAEVKLMNADGHELTLAQEAGKHGTLVIFACNHCPWVKAWEDRLVSIGNTYTAKGIGVVAVNSNDPQAYPADGLPQMQELARDKNYGFPYVMDTTSEVGRAFGASHTPEAYLFDASGKLVYHGAIDDNARDPGAVQHAYLRDALDSVLTGQHPAVQETKALGCSIVFRSK